MKSQLILGTAQFSAGYGVTNFEKDMDESSKQKLVNSALANGFSGIDTSPAYGMANKVLESCNLSSCEVTSKFNFPEKIDVKTIARLKTEIRTSNNFKLHNLITHDPSFLTKMSVDQINSVFDAFKNESLAKNVGVTLYSTEQLDYLLDAGIICDVVQVPANLLDQRFSKNPKLIHFVERGGRVQARSIFLQGLILGKSLPKKFKKYESYFSKLRKYSIAQKISIIELTFIYLMNCKIFTDILVGVSNINELLEICKCYQMAKINNERNSFNYSHFLCREQNLIDPSRWKNLR